MTVAKEEEWKDGQTKSKSYLHDDGNLILPPVSSLSENQDSTNIGRDNILLDDKI